MKQSQEPTRRERVLGIVGVTALIGVLEVVDIQLQAHGFRGLGGTFGQALGNMGQGASRELRAATFPERPTPQAAPCDEAERK